MGLLHPRREGEKQHIIGILVDDCQLCVCMYIYIYSIYFDIYIYINVCVYMR